MTADDFKQTLKALRDAGAKITCSICGAVAPPHGLVIQGTRRKWVCSAECEKKATNAGGDGPT